jgi:hypothetical protein
LEAFHLCRGGAGRGEGWGGVAGGVAGDVGEGDAVAEGVGLAAGEVWGESVGPGEGVVAGGGDGDGGGRSWYGLTGLVIELAAEGGGEGCAAEGELVGGARGHGEAELDGIADAGCGEVADRLWEVEGWGARNAGTGAADGCEGDQQRRPAAMGAGWTERRVHGIERSTWLGKQAARAIFVRIVRGEHDAEGPNRVYSSCRKGY